MPRINATLVLLLAAASVPAAQDWSQWRGPGRTGVAAAFKAPAAWPDRPTLVWKIDAGAGHASPVIASGRVYLHSRVGEQEVVAAYELSSGKPVWRQVYDAPYEMNPAARGHGKGPKSTPVLETGRLFTFGIGGILSAWDASSGRLLWRKDFRREFKATAPDFGVAMSPLVDDELLVVHAGGPDSGALLGLAASTGAVRWAWKGEGPAYASPVVARFAGVPQVVTQSRTHVISVALADGRELWRIPFTTDYDQNIITPLIDGELLIYGGLGRPTTAVKVRQQGGKWTHEAVWANAEIPVYMSTPVIASGHLYGLTHRNRGQFFCVDLKDGRTLWTTRGREAENAAFAVAGDLLLATTTEGELVVAQANPKAFELVKRYTLAESPIWAHPAIAAAGIVIKDAEALGYWRF
ncbi:MAG TPA: PQQ-binding-like beta-propeller repeat protein [Vicinamibacterales bacterium]|nr:PQQ-binding-like beta-propeller repeat protein [Vicinamibacterales bacterium]